MTGRNASDDADTVPTVLAVDLGGTKIVSCLVSGRRILSIVKEKTDVNAGPAAVIGQIVDCCGQTLSLGGTALRDVAGVGVAVPGLVDPSTGTVIEAPNLGWQSVRARDRLEAALGRPVVLENDVNAGLVGETAFGALRPFAGDPVAGFFVGTGVGGALMLDGRLMAGVSGVAGELGHMTVLAGGPRCGCGSRGCLEALAGRAAIERALGKKRGRLTSRRIKKALERKGRKKVRKALRDAAWYLGIGVSNVINIFNPRAVVLGGGLMEAVGAQVLPDVVESARKHSFERSFRDCRILLSALGDDAVPVGVARLVLTRNALAKAAVS